MTNPVSDKTLPPPPVRTPIKLENGQLAAPWVRWFQLLYSRVGGSFSIPLSDVDVLVAYGDSTVGAALGQLKDLRDELLVRQDQQSFLQVIKRLDELSNLLAQVRDPVNRYYVENDWNPSFTGLVITGSVGLAGKYVRHGRKLDWEVTITPTGGGTSAATRGTTYLNNLPYRAGRYGVLTAIDATTFINISTGLVDSGTKNAYVPTWAATPNKIVLQGSVQVQEG